MSFEHVLGADMIPSTWAVQKIHTIIWVHAKILKVECNFKLCQLHLCLGYGLSPFKQAVLCCPPNCPTSWFMSHEVPEREERLAAQAAVLYYDVSNLCCHKWVLTSMKNSPAAQVSSCTWWSLQPDCSSAVPPVLADGVLEKESWPTSLAAVSPWGSF